MIKYFSAVISTHDGSVHSCACDGTAHQHFLLLLCWERVLCQTCYHLMFILPSWFTQLHHTLWVCTRSWTVFYLQHHYGVLARWSYSWYKYHNCQCRQADNAWRLFLRQDSNSYLQWASWPQLHKYGGVQNAFLSFYHLQQTFEIHYYYIWLHVYWFLWSHVFTICTIRWTS